MSGSRRSANAVISDWKASHTTRKGILYSRLPVLVAVVQHPPHLHGVHGRVPRHVRHEDHQRVDAVRIAAPRVGDHVVHQPVRRRAGTPTRRPCRCAPASPSPSTNRSSGEPGQPSARPPSGVSGLIASGPLGGFAGGGIARGNGALWRKPPGRSIVPRSAHQDRRARESCGSRSSARRARASRGTRRGCRSPTRAPCPSSRSTGSAARSSGRAR